jgi:hypothetical protein
MSSEQQPIVLRGRETGTAIGRLVWPGVFALAVVLVFAVARLITRGNSSDYLVLLVGSLLSGPIVLYWGLLAAIKPKRSWPLALLSWSAFIPYVFGVYLVGYRGIWRLVLLYKGFSWLQLVSAVIFVVLGWAVVNSLYRATEFVEAVHEGRVKLE